MPPEKIWLHDDIDSYDLQLYMERIDKNDIEYIRADTVIDPDKVEQLVEILKYMADKGNWNIPDNREDGYFLFGHDAPWELSQEAIAQYHKE